MPDAQWKSIKARCAGQVGSLVELLQGRLSKSVMDVVTQRAGGLFPRPSEIKMECSCPDWAGMCKHVAAVMYGVGARLDEKPELLFLLRKVDHMELIAEAVDDSTAVKGKGGKLRGKKTIADADIANVFGIEMIDADAAAGPAPLPQASDPLQEPTKARAPRAPKTSRVSPPKAPVKRAEPPPTKTRKASSPGQAAAPKAKTKSKAKAKAKPAEHLVAVVSSARPSRRTGSSRGTA